MKRTISLLLSCLLICTLLVACGSKESHKQDLEDGKYTIELTLSGGSGRSHVESPATMIVKDGKTYATVVWSSPFYEYMLVEDTKYEPVQTEGNSTFEIPITLDEDMEVCASTIAMSEPHEVEYTLHFDSSTIARSAQEE